MTLLLSNLDKRCAKNQNFKQFTLFLVYGFTVNSNPVPLRFYSLFLSSSTLVATSSFCEVLNTFSEPSPPRMANVRERIRYSHFFGTVDDIVDFKFCREIFKKLFLNEIFARYQRGCMCDIYGVGIHSVCVAKL